MADALPDPLPDALVALRGWTPSAGDPPVLEGAVDVHRSDDDHVLFSTSPCRGPWLRVPSGAVASVVPLGEVRCGPVAWPRVRMELDPGDPASVTVVDAVRAGLRVGGGGAHAEGGGSLLGGAGAEEGESHDVRVEVRPEGKLYRIRLQVEGHEVRDVTWDAERKIYLAEVSGLPVEDALDVHVQAWGNDGAGLVCSVEVDGRPLEPPLEVRVGERPGEGRRSYRL